MPESSLVAESVEWQEPQRPEHFKGRGPTRWCRLGFHKKGETWSNYGEWGYWCLYCGAKVRTGEERYAGY